MKATRGNIGKWNINTGITSGEPWIDNQPFSVVSPGSLIMRRNGIVENDEKVEVIMGYLGMGIEVGTRITNNMPKNNNAVLVLQAQNGLTNIAIQVLSGISRLQSISYGVQFIDNADTVINGDATLVVVNGLAGGVGNPNLFMPPNAVQGRMITVKNNSNGGCTLQSNAGNGSFVGVDGSYNNPVLLFKNNCRSYVFDGVNWIEYSTH